jgi:hypothetical protein
MDLVIYVASKSAVLSEMPTHHFGISYPQKPAVT